MNYAAIKQTDIANGTGVRVSLFVSGCTHHCLGCFNREAWDFGYGEPFTDQIQEHLLDLLKPSYIAGLSLLGGEPFEPENQRALLPFLKRVKKEYPEKTIWCYTGYLMDQDLLQESKVRCEATAGLLFCIDVLVDGAFIQEEKDISLKFRGSRNQRIIDVPKSLEMGKVTVSASSGTA